MQYELKFKGFKTLNFVRISIYASTDSTGNLLGL